VIAPPIEARSGVNPPDTIDVTAAPTPIVVATAAGTGPPTVVAEDAAESHALPPPPKSHQANIAGATDSSAARRPRRHAAQTAGARHTAIAIQGTADDPNRVAPIAPDHHHAPTHR
jgi:hypothetical protein